MAKLTRNKYVGDPSLNGFRLTLTSGTPVTTADVTGATTVYVTPYRGDHVVLFDGTNYQLYQPAEMSLALGTLADASNYDIWLYPNAGVPTLEFSAAWTNDTTRSEAIATTNGVTHKSGDQTRRLVGTIRTTSTTTTEDSEAKRFCANQDNRAQRVVRAVESTDSWSYNTAAWRQANGSAANQVGVVACDGVNPACVQVSVWARSLTAGDWFVPGIGVDSTTSNAAQVLTPIQQYAAGYYGPSLAKYDGHVGIGYHYLAWLEYASASGTVTWIGDNGATVMKSGLSGTVWN